jgi:hypothetical protein
MNCVDILARTRAEAYVMEPGAALLEALTLILGGASSNSEAGAAAMQ